MSLALPSIVQVGDTEFVHAKMEAAALINEGSRCEHWMFVTPNDDASFMLFTADNYLGPVENFFDKLREMRAKETPIQEVKPYDKRKYMPYKGNVRKEDIMTQGTQGLLGERRRTAGRGGPRGYQISQDRLGRHRNRVGGPTAEGTLAGNDAARGGAFGYSSGGQRKAQLKITNSKLNNWVASPS